MIGSTIAGRWRVGEYMISGATGRVYHGVDLVFGQPVVIKALLDAEPVEVQRLCAEAQLSRRLRHRNIVHVHDWGRSGDGAYMVMAWHGEPLQERLLHGPIESAQAAEVARQIADALAYVHAQGFVHRDVRTWNILTRRERDGQVRATLIDFGCAKPREHDERYASAQRAVSLGRVLGGPRRVDPPDKRLALDPRHDIFCLGVVLFLMLSPDALPFVHWESRRWIHRVQTAEPGRLAARLGGGERAMTLQRIVARCIDESPDCRYPTAADLEAALASAC